MSGEHTVKRYVTDRCWEKDCAADLILRDSGISTTEVVKATDYDAIAAERDRLREALRELVREADKFRSLKGDRHDLWVAMDKARTLLEWKP